MTTLFPKAILDLAAAVLDDYRRAGRRLTTAESCTGGLVAGALTEIAGSSDVVRRGFVTYSNAAKVEILGVPEAVLERHGAVSAETVLAMAEGALVRAGDDAHAALSVSGVAGPGGGSPVKPVGTVWIAVASREKKAEAHHFVFPGDRAAIRLAAVEAALRLLGGRAS
ncbi:MAG: CinA family protein [Alphaproteobacteria bacterium]|nr:CinA family protein [Alphaproteobacteria bacterium]